MARLNAALIRSGALVAGAVILCPVSDETLRAGLKPPPTPATTPDSFFDSPRLSTFRVDLGPAEYAQLGRAPRSYVPGRVSIDDRVFQVGVRLQGTGNFQPISEHPNLSIKFNWGSRDEEFAGLTKLYLKNARQDPSLLCELAAGGAFRDAGLPTPRVTHARVELNGRDLGLCVVAEAVNKRFLRRYFKDEHGALYEGAFRDIRSTLEQDNGVRSGAADLRALRAAATLADRAERRQALAGLLDIEKFLDFLAVEMIVANWDGYAMHQNNYRVYHDPGSDRMTFIPHGLDNTFFESGLALVPPRKSVLAAALLETPEDREAFRQRMGKLAGRLLEPKRLNARLREAVAKMKQGASAKECEAIERHACLIARHAGERLRRIEAELAGEHPEIPAFSADGIAPLDGWKAKPDWNDSPVERLVVAGKEVLSVRARNGFCFGSWRLPVWLPAGRYRFEGVAATEGVRGLPSMTGSGAGVRVLGAMRGGGLDGARGWTPVTFEFAVRESGEWVELIAELRAFSGSAQFDPAKLRLVRVTP